MDYPVPNFHLPIVTPKGFEGPTLETQSLTINQACDAISADMTVTFGCSFIGCTHTGTPATMKNLDRNRVYEGAVAPVCPNHAEELYRSFGISSFQMATTIRNAVEPYQAKQRLATMARFLLPGSARSATNGATPRLHLATASR